MDIKYKLEIHECSVYFQVLEMKASLRGSFNFRSSNGLNVRSIHCVQLSPDSVYIRGTNEELDNYIEELVFDNELKAKKYYNRAKFALEEAFGKPSTWTITFKYGHKQEKRKSSCK